VWDRRSETTQENIMTIKTLTGKVLVTVRDYDATLWGIGDALVAECGPPDNTKAVRALIAECAQELADHGCEIDRQQLARFHKVAQSFPKSARRPTLSWAVHAAAGSPDMLDAIVRGAHKPITAKYARLVVRGWREENKRTQI